MVRGALDSRGNPSMRSCNEPSLEELSHLFEGKSKPNNNRSSKEADEYIFTKLKSIFRGQKPGSKQDTYSEDNLTPPLTESFDYFTDHIYDGSVSMQGSTALPSFEMCQPGGAGIMNGMCGGLGYGDSMNNFDRLAEALVADSTSYATKEASSINLETPLTHLALMDTTPITDVVTPLGVGSMDVGCDFSDRVGKLLERCMSNDDEARHELVALCATEFNLDDSVLSPAVVKALLRFCLLNGQLYLAGQLLQIAWEGGLRLEVGEQCEVLLALCSDGAMGLVRCLLSKIPFPSATSEELLSRFIKGVICTMQESKNNCLNSFVEMLVDRSSGILDTRRANYLIQLFFDELLGNKSKVHDFENIALKLCRVEAFTKLPPDLRCRTCAILCQLPSKDMMDEALRSLLNGNNIQVSFLDYISKNCPSDLLSMCSRLVTVKALGGLGFLCTLYLASKNCRTGASVLKLCLLAQQKLKSVVPDKLRSPGFGDFEFLSCAGINSLVKLLGPSLPSSLLSVCASVSAAGREMFSPFVEVCLLVNDHSSAESILKYMNEYYGQIPQSVLEMTWRSYLSHGKFRQVLDQISKHKQLSLSKSGNYSGYGSIAEFGLRIAASNIKFAIANEFVKYCSGNEKISSELSVLLQQLPTMIETKNQAEEFVNLCECLNLDEGTFAALMDCCLRYKNTKRLLRLVGRFRKMGLQPQLQTCGVIIKSLGCCGRIAECKEIWHELTAKRGQQPNEVTYGIMLDALVSNNEMDEAMKLFEEMKRKKNVKPNTIMYTTLIKGFSQNRQLGKAMKVYKEMVTEGVTRNTVTYNSIIDACARVGDMKNAAALLEEMMENNVEPDLITFSTIIKGYCVQSNMDQSFQLLSIMYERGIKPDGILYNSLLEGCVKSGRLWLCEKLWGEMREHGIPPSNFTLTILIKMYGRSGQLDKVFDLVGRLPVEYGFNINAHVYTCLMSACIANGRYAAAIDVYKCMKDAGIKPDVRTYETLLLAASRGRHYMEAAEILTDMSNPGGSKKGELNPQGDGAMLRKITPRILENLFNRVQNGKVDPSVLGSYRMLSKRLQALGINVNFTS